MRILFALALALLPAAASAELRAGFAKVDITPDRPVPLAGYGARKGNPSTGVHDPVFARAAVFESGGRKAAILSLDTVGVTAEVRGLLLKGVCADLGIADGDFLLCATHNHSGPGALSKNILIRIAAGKFDQELFDWMLGRLTLALRDANAALAPARIALRRATFPGLTRNRAVDGGPVDEEGFVVRISGEDGKVRAVFLNWATHPTIIDSDSFEISAEWPGAMCRAIEEAYPGSFPFFLNGAEGDQSPVTPGGKDDWEKVESMGRAVAGIVKTSVEAMAGQEADAEVGGRISHVKLPPMPFAGDWPTESSIALFDLGPLRLFCFPGEPCVAVGQAVRLLEPGPLHVAGTVCCANDHLGYFVPPEYYFRGGYESTLDFLGPDTLDWFVARFAEFYGKKGPAAPAPSFESATAGRAKLVTVRGTPWARGLGHGRALSSEIKTHLAFWRAQLANLASVLPVRDMLPFPEDLDPAPLLFPLVAIRCRLLLRKCDPDLLTEMRGIADGAGVSFDEIVFLNTWLAVADQTDPTALFRMKPGCATLSAGAFLAHNTDWPAAKGFPDVAVLLVQIPETGTPFAMMTFAGCAGAPVAMTADGVAAAVDSLPSLDDTGLDGVPVWLSLRAALDGRSSASDVAEALSKTPGTAGYVVTIRDTSATVSLQISATRSERDPADPRPAPKHDKKRRAAVAAFLKATTSPDAAAIRALMGERDAGVLAPGTRHSVVIDLENKTWWVATGPGKEISKDAYAEVKVAELFRK